MEGSGGREGEGEARAPALSPAHEQERNKKALTPPPPPPTKHHHPPTQHGASKDKGPVLVPEHVPKVKDFFSRACWAHHPLPYADYVAAQKAEQAALEAERCKLPRVPS